MLTKNCIDDLTIYGTIDAIQKVVLLFLDAIT